MQANHGKFKAIDVGKKTHDKTLTLNISDTYIKCKDVVKFLAVDIDYQLNFDQHTSKLCRSQHVVSVESSSLFHHSIYL